LWSRGFWITESPTRRERTVLSACKEGRESGETFAGVPPGLTAENRKEKGPRRKVWQERKGNQATFWPKKNSPKHLTKKGGEKKTQKERATLGVKHQDAEEQPRRMKNRR